MVQFPTASFPDFVWDTLTRAREGENDYISPGPEEYMNLLAEIEALERYLIPAAEENVIWISPDGRATGSGSIVNPFATLADAFGAITATKKVVVLRPGIYTPVNLDLPVTQDDIKVIGIGGPHVTFINGADTIAVLSLKPAAQGAPFTFTLQGLTVQAAGTRTAFYTDLASQDDDVTINLRNMRLLKGGDSIDHNHAVAGQWAKFNLDHCYLDGVFNAEFANASDEINISRSKILGNMVTNAAAVTASIIFKYSIIKTAGVSGGHANQTIESLYCMTSGNALAATTEFAGSHTETLIAPTS